MMQLADQSHSRERLASGQTRVDGNVKELKAKEFALSVGNSPTIAYSAEKIQTIQILENVVPMCMIRSVISHISGVQPVAGLLHARRRVRYQHSARGQPSREGGRESENKTSNSYLCSQGCSRGFKWGPLQPITPQNFRTAPASRTGEDVVTTTNAKWCPWFRSYNEVTTRLVTPVVCQRVVTLTSGFRRMI